MGSFCIAKGKEIDRPSKPQQNKAKRDEKDIIQINFNINEIELKLLKLIYSDLSSRTAKGELNLENFLLFFHKNGYWGERLFNQFNSKNSTTITQTQFVKGIIRIFKTTQEQKIELLYKFFAESNFDEGIPFANFLRMLYNYPKQDLKVILNDQQFINNEIKNNLISIDQDMNDGKRLESLQANELKKGFANGKSYRLQESESNSERKDGPNYRSEKMIKNDQRKTSWRIKVGENDIQIKTSSIHHLVKKYARSIFKVYNISEKFGRFKYRDFRDWILRHKNLYNVYYEGFHCQAWECSKFEDKPAFIAEKMDYSSKAQFYEGDNKKNVVISLLHSVLIVCQQYDKTNPIAIICLEGLAAGAIFTDEKGHGIEISHRDGIYRNKFFYFINEEIQKNWIQYLKFYQGTSINQLYEIKEKIGTGKFSVVYHCIEKETNNHYAMKVIEAFKLDTNAKKILHHESSIMSVMSNHLLVYFKQSIATKTHIYIITQLVKGKDLFDFVRDLKHLDEPEVMYILEQIILGVKYIHSLGIVHRDLKPENIMIQFNENDYTIGKVKIIDFGFANYLNKVRQMPQDQLLVGTPNYIAPEILRNDSFDERIDNFAIGSIFYYLLSGNLPFNGNDVRIIIQKTVYADYSFSGWRWRGISDEAKDLVSMFLENDQTKRITLQQSLKHPWFTKIKSDKKISIGTHLKNSIERERDITMLKQKDRKQLII